jgi:diguanylate cyclase (GGDEF)-like protein
MTAKGLIRTLLLPLVVVSLAVSAGAAVAVLQGRADSGRRAQLEVARMRYALQSLGDAPFEASPQAGGSPGFAHSLIIADELTITRALSSLERSSPLSTLRSARSMVAAMKPAIDRIFWIGAYGGGYNGKLGAQIQTLQGRQQIALNAVDIRLARASAIYAGRASSAKLDATIGSLATIALLLMTFAALYRRTVRSRDIAAMLAAENGDLLAASRTEAVTDALTGLGNRRALIADLEARLADADAGHELMLALFDLDGFKEYNDTFGHPSGDALLARLGDRLSCALEGEVGAAYRMGGDEFCVLVVCERRAGARIAARAARALSETGEAFRIGCSYGTAHVPADAATPADALRLADDRMYEHKSSRASAGRQSADVLLRALAERSPGLTDHLSHVAALATATARRIGLGEADIKRIQVAAELHDVGKVAIPDSILNKPGPLDPDERVFMQRHTEIGERIINAAPALANAAQLVRWSHERHDGTGYPDRLAGEQIPLAASIITVCDAFDAMTSHRPYADAMTHTQALAELRRCAGTQFHPDVVHEFCELIKQDATAADHAAGKRVPA